MRLFSPLLPGADVCASHSAPPAAFLRPVVPVVSPRRTAGLSGRSVPHQPLRRGNSADTAHKMPASHVMPLDRMPALTARSCIRSSNIPTLSGFGASRLNNSGHNSVRRLTRLRFFRCRLVICRHGVAPVGFCCAFWLPGITLCADVVLSCCRCAACVVFYGVP